jgi:hypothetical protein
VGDRISHPKYGDGTIIGATSLGGNTPMTMYEIAFESCGTKKIIPPKGMKKI